MKRKTVKKRSAPKGFDLGCLRRVALMSDVSFVQNLNKANVFGCGYGLPGHGPGVPGLILICKHGENLRKAFEGFRRWGSATDGDVVEIDIALWKDGTFEMAISPEMRRMEFRTLPQPYLYDPLMFGMTWLKPFDSTHANLRSIAAYTQRLISPVLISGGVLADGAPPLVRGTSQDSAIMPLTDFPNLLKFELKILEEDDVTPQSVLWWRRERRQKPKSKSSKEKGVEEVPPATIAKSRSDTIRIAFPVTKERIQKAGYIRDVKSRDGFQSISDVQVVQAVINLILSAEICDGRSHYSGMGSKFNDEIWDYIFRRWELADSKALPHFDVQEICKQIEYDVSALYRYLKRPDSGLLEAKQTSLRDEGYYK
ncbi:MAG: hypothetical protein ACTHPD_05955 [Rhizomicrobium sp.]